MKVSPGTEHLTNQIRQLPTRNVAAPDLNFKAHEKRSSAGQLPERKHAFEY